MDAKFVHGSVLRTVRLEDSEMKIVESVSWTWGASGDRKQGTSVSGPVLCSRAWHSSGTRLQCIRMREVLTRTPGQCSFMKIEAKKKSIYAPMKLQRQSCSIVEYSSRRNLEDFHPKVHNKENSPEWGRRLSKVSQLRCITSPLALHAGLSPKLTMLTTCICFPPPARINSLDHSLDIHTFK